MKHRNLKLNENDREYLNNVVKKAKEMNRARILLLLDKGKKIQEIVDILDISESTVAKIKKRYLNDGLDVALNDKPKSGQPKKYDDKKEAEIIALACTDPPKGRKQWTVRLIAEELNKYHGFETITRESVRVILKKHQQNHGLKKCGV
jgi:transposase